MPKKKTRQQHLTQIPSHALGADQECMCAYVWNVECDVWLYKADGVANIAE